jgi:AcrR family transcriptional regulator
VREEILVAALAILGESGLQHLTQVQVATRAGVRQSHLTYYFPTRDHLLKAVAERGVDGIASGLRRVVRRKGGQGRRLLERLATSIADLAHMRIFVGMILEADRDPAVRRALQHGTRRMEATVADALGGDQAAERARVVLAAVWGLALYRFVMRASTADPTRRFLSWLAETSTNRESPRPSAPMRA